MTAQGPGQPGALRVLERGGSRPLTDMLPQRSAVPANGPRPPMRAIWCIQRFTVTGGPYPVQVSPRLCEEEICCLSAAVGVTVGCP
jgi:hypothetical protein